jgi:hypothetical protein
VADLPVPVLSCPSIVTVFIVMMID